METQTMSSNGTGKSTARSYLGTVSKNGAKYVTSLKELRNPTNETIRVVMPASLFATLEPIGDQQERGERVIRQGRVEELKKIGIANVLDNSMLLGPIILFKGQTNSGNHRCVAVKESIPKDLDSNYPVEAYLLPDSTDGERLSKIAYTANRDGIRVNYRVHAVNSAMPISLKVFKPVDIVFSPYFGKSITLNNRYQLSLYVGGLLNTSPSLCAHLKDGRFLGWNGKQLFQAKSNKSCNEHFDSQPVNVDLTGKEIARGLEKNFGPGMLAIKQAVEAGFWKEKLGGNTMMQYVLLGLSSSNKLRYGDRKLAWADNNQQDYITVAQFLSFLNKPAEGNKRSPGGKLFDLIEKYNGGEIDKTHEKILSLLGTVLNANLFDAE